MTEKWPFLAILYSSFPALATRERSAVDRNRLKHMHSNCPKGQKHHIYTPQYGQKGDLRTPPVWPALEMMRPSVATFCELKAPFRESEHHIYPPQYGQKGDLRTPPVWPALEMISTGVATFCELKAARPLIPRRSTSHKALKGTKETSTSGEKRTHIPKFCIYSIDLVAGIEVFEVILT